MPKNNSILRVGYSMAALACSLSTTAVAAQEVAAAHPTTGKTTTASSAEATTEILVTAQKREQSVQKIGVSVTAIGAEGLKSLGKQDISALTTQLPSVQVNQYSPTITVFNIRGVSQNDFSDSQEAPIAFYNDEVYISSLGAISGQNFDLQRIEVLRGPQGTLFGRNATGGLIQVITAKPTDTLDGFASLTAGSYGQIGSEAAISGPLSDRVRARLSFTSNHNGGYIENRIGRDLGYQNFIGARGQIEADVGDSGKLLLKGQMLHNRDSGQGYGYIGAVPGEYGLGRAIGPNETVVFTNYATGATYTTCPGCDAYGYKEPDKDPFTGSFNTPGYFRRTFYSGTARYTDNLGFAALTSITDYQHLKKGYTDDTDGSPNDIFRYTTGQRLNQFSQELRLNGDKDAFHWVAGAYFFSLNTANNYGVVANFIEPIGHDVVDYYTRTRTRSEAVFGQVEYPLTDTLSVIGGARYTWEQKKLDYSIDDPVVGYSLAISPSTDPDLTKEHFGNYSGKVEIDYKPSRDALLYASVNRGTKGGGFGTLGSIPPALQFLKFGQEELTSYETGYKLTLLDGRMRFNGSFFYYHYQNYQAYSVIGTTQFVTNNKARSKGVELELSGTAAPGLTYQIFGSWLDAKVYNVIAPSGDSLTRQMPQAPRWSAGGMLRYGFDAFGGKLAVETDWKWNSSQYFTVFNAPIDRQRAYAVGNARIEFTPSSLPVDVSFFVQNVADKHYLVYSLDQSGFPLGYADQVYAHPRWFGSTVTLRFR